MTGKYIRDAVNLLLYGGGYIGLCAACLTAYVFELTGTVQAHFGYVMLIGCATAALYSLHRVIGLNRVLPYSATGRYATIRIYQTHIRIYTILWMILATVYLLPLLSPEFIFWLLPGGLIGALYVMPLFPGGKRLRDLGWGKILMLGWSWSWLTCVVPMGYFLDASPFLVSVLGLMLMGFIILLAIPFEIRDIRIDRSLGLITLPERIGPGKTMGISIVLVAATSFLAMLASFHYFNTAFGLSMTLVCLLTLPMIRWSYTTEDDYYFAGLVDGLMILLPCLFILLRPLVN